MRPRHYIKGRPQATMEDFKKWYEIRKNYGATNEMLARRFGYNRATISHGISEYKKTLTNKDK